MAMGNKSVGDSSSVILYLQCVAVVQLWTAAMVIRPVFISQRITGLSRRSSFRCSVCIC